MLVTAIAITTPIYTIIISYSIRVGLPDFAHKNIGCPGKSEFHVIINNSQDILIPKKFIVYLKFKFNWAFSILSGNSILE